MSERPAPLETENLFLREQLQTLRERAIETESLFHRHQEWELELLAATSLDRLLLCLTTEMRSRFAVDVARLLLHDSERSLRALLMHDEQGLQVLTDTLFLDDELPPVLERMQLPWVGPLHVVDLPPVFVAADSIRSAAIVPLWRQKQRFGLLGIGSRDPARYSSDLETHFLRRMGAVAAVCLENAINRARLEIGSLTDALTGLHNRRALDQRLQDEIARACRTRQPLSCLFMDIDFFKQINDKYGHARGDTALVRVAHRLRSALRGSDIAVRFGGDELLVLLPITDAEAAMHLAQRIHEIVTKQPFDLGDGLLLPLTVSIGIATVSPTRQDESLQSVGHKLLDTADAALYAAKRAGRNRISSATIAVSG